MDKIKLPIEWHDLAEEFLDADGQIITIDRITEALNTAADKDRQIAVLVEALEHYGNPEHWDRGYFEDGEKTGNDDLFVPFGDGYTVATEALSESKRIQEGE